MKSLITFIIILILLKATNPDMQSHKNAITQKCKELNPITGAIGGCNLFGTYAIKYVNYQIFSYTMSGEELISVGFLTMPLIVKNLDF